MIAGADRFPTLHRLLPAARFTGRILGWVAIVLFALATAYFVLTGLLIAIA